MRLLSWLRQRMATHLGDRPNGKHRPAPRCRLRLETLEDRWLPSTLTVLNTADSGPGSLRAEVAAAQNGDTIIFDPSLAGQGIGLTSGVAINKSLTIDAGSAPQLYIEGQLDVTSSSANVTLDNLTMAGGVADDGGALINAGSLTLNNCFFDSVTAANQGGAVYNTGSGTMAVNDCYFLSNVAGADGGAIENHGAMTLTGCTFIQNQVEPLTGSVKPKSMQFNGGGAIDNHGTLTISGCNFGGDSAMANSSLQKTGGGDVANFGTLTVTGSSFGGITFGPEADGGSIANFGTASVANSAIGGIADGAGGAVFNAGNMTISNSTLVASAVLGGDIYNSGNLALVASTVSTTIFLFPAQAGGGIYNSGTLTLSASTVTGNTAIADGGGIYNTGTLYILNGSNVAGNSAPAGADLYNLGTVEISSDSTVGVIGP